MRDHAFECKVQKRLNRASCLLGIVALIAMMPLEAQTVSVHPIKRITSAVDDRVRVAIKNDVAVAGVGAGVDQGPSPASTQMSHVRLVLKRGPQQEAALEAFMSQQLDKSSPNYHKWLTPEQFGKLYGPSDADIATIQQWLESENLHVGPIPKGRTSIEFSGTVGDIQRAFSVSIHGFSRDGKQYLANVNTAQIPAALAPVVGGIVRLNTSLPRRQTTPGIIGSIDPSSKKITPAALSSQLPMLTAGSSFLYVTPADAATIYDTPVTKFNANYTSGPTYDGTGVNIGIGGTSLVNTAPLVAYRELFEGDNKAPITVNDYGATLSDDGEADLDLEMSGGLAPGATIYYYPSPDLFSGVLQAAEDNKVDIFSMSFGGCELFDGDGANQFFYQMWQQFAAQGITVVVASGDGGAAGCDFGYTGVATAVQYGLQVSGLASTPYNLAVGGTDYIGLVENGFGTYVSQNDGPFFRSALGYIPESAMNGSTWPNGALADNVPFWLAVGTGGGRSSCVTTTTDSSGNTVCVSGWPKPVWQSGPGVPHDGARDLPDVSLLMANGLYGATWIACTDDEPCYNGSVTGIGGTSASTPAFAGILAEIVQKTGGRLGQPAPILYKIAREPASKGQPAFHDITVGNNSMQCVEGTLNCALNAAGHYFLTGYDTTPGYDMATGLGTPDVINLMNAWPAANTGSLQATVDVSPVETIVDDDKNLHVLVSVTGSGPLPPSGTVTLTLPTYGSKPVQLSPGAQGGTADFVVLARDLQLVVNDAGAGPQPVLVTYSGDGNYSAATGSSTVSIVVPSPGQ